MPDGQGDGGEGEGGRTSSRPLPTVDQLRQLVEQHQGSIANNLQREWARRFRSVSVESEEKYEHLKGLREHYIHKGRWSNFLMLVMLGMVGFQCFLLGMVGAGEWDFTKYEWLLPLLLVQNLAQIIGLAVFVVKSLFRDQRH